MYLCFYAYIELIKVNLFYNFVFIYLSVQELSLWNLLPLKNDLEPRSDLQLDLWRKRAPDPENQVCPSISSFISVKFILFMCFKPNMSIYGHSDDVIMPIYGQKFI